jgi:hypothetical protein
MRIDASYNPKRSGDRENMIAEMKTTRATVFHGKDDIRVEETERPLELSQVRS